MFFKRLEPEDIIIFEQAVFFCAIQGQHRQDFVAPGDGHLKGVVDIVAVVKFLIDGGIEPLVVFQQITFPDDHGFGGVDAFQFHVFPLCFFEGGGKTAGIGKMERAIGFFHHKDTAIAERDQKL